VTERRRQQMFHRVLLHRRQ